MMLHLTILETIWFLLPAGVANSMPVIAAHLRWLSSFNRPVDLGLKFRGRRVLGDNKTWRGLIVGIISGSVTGLLQGSFTIGLLLSVGALAGDVTGSFIKRQLNIVPGGRWVPFDQIDFMLGALLIGWFIFPLTFVHVISALIIFGFGSYFFSVISVILKIKRSL